MINDFLHVSEYTVRRR